MIRSSTASRVLLVADRRPVGSDLGAVAVRRFRLARMRLDGRSAGAAAGQPVKRA
jgi:hypothetical protein